MSPMAKFELPIGCLERAEQLLATGQRTILGIVAPPGAGKSTVAETLEQTLKGRAQVVPMDGFHLSNAALERLGRAGRKGAPDTFDADGYANLLGRLRTQNSDAKSPETIYAPLYLRTLEEGIAGSLAIHASTQLIITEGNYLLLDDGGWAAVRTLLDEVWYLDIDDALRESRLLARHMQFGKNREQALAWIAETDAPNARKIASTRSRADCIFSV
jgi:pantothenate kinase